MNVVRGSGKPTLGTIRAAGIKMGALCMRQILDLPTLPAATIKEMFLSRAKVENEKFLAAGEIDQRGVAEFHSGFDRGMELQRQNPNARIEVKGVSCGTDRCN